MAHICVGEFCGPYFREKGSSAAQHQAIIKTNRVYSQLEPHGYIPSKYVDFHSRNLTNHLNIFVVGTGVMCYQNYDHRVKTHSIKF